MHLFFKKNKIKFFTILMVFILSIFLFIQNTIAQIFIPMVFWGPKGTFILDRIPAATAGYSLRKIRASYAGNAIQIRRPSDNAVQDIGFKSNGDLNDIAVNVFLDQMMPISLTYPTDSLVTQPTSSYSLRKLKSTYSGSALRVRRSSDNTEQDIGFATAGALDTSALNTFLSGGGAGTLSYPMDQTVLSGKGAYSFRKLRTGYAGNVMQVRRSIDNSLFDLSFLSNGEPDIPTLQENLNGTVSNSTLNPLDSVTATNTGGYALRKLKNSYAGSALRVRRGNDNTEQDIGFTGGGALDTTALNTFLSGGGASSNLYPLDQTIISAKGAYSLRKIKAGYAGSAIQVRRATDNKTLDIGFNASGDFDTTKYNNFVNNSYTLDLVVTQPAMALSLRKVKNVYVGNLIRVRRSSDNTEQDIGFTVDGVLDTASLLTFIGAGTGYVSKWYDQSGNGRNAVQATLALQPQISNTNGKWAVISNGSQYLTSSGTVGQMTAAGAAGTSILVARPQTQQSTLFGAMNSVSCNDRWAAHIIWFDSTLYFDPGSVVTSRINTAVGGASSIVNTWTQISLTRAAGSSNIRWNGVLKNTNATASGSTTMTAANWGVLTATNSVACGLTTSATVDMSEYFQYATNLSVADATILENDQGLYYGININGSAVTTTGFVAKWYDQSGNGNDLVQATVASQPSVVLSGINSKPSVQFGANLFLQSAGNVTFNFGTTVNVVAKGSTSGTTYCALFGQDYASNNGAGLIGGVYDPGTGWGYGFNGYNAANSWFGAATATVFPATSFIGTGIFNPGQSITAYYYSNGVLIKTGTNTVAQMTATNPLKMGGAFWGQSNASYYYNGMVSEAIMSDNAALNEQRIFLEANQGSYYGVSVPASPAMGYITKWYDQSGAAQDLVQAIQSKQPILIKDPNTNKTTIFFNALYNSVLTGNYSGTVQSASAVYGLNNGTISGGGSYASLGGFDTTKRLFTHYVAATTPYSDVSDLPNGSIKINGINPTTTNSLNLFMMRTQVAASPTTLSGSSLSIGQNGVSSTYTSLSSSEVLLFSNVLSPADRILIEGNQSNYYAVTGSSASTGYVAKWYDQSGNGNDLIQATVASQPSVIVSGINSKPSVQFGANLFLQSAGNVTFTSGTTVNVVAKGTSTLNWSIIFGQNFVNTVSPNGSAGLIGGTYSGVWGYGFGGYATPGAWYGSVSTTQFPSTAFISSGLYKPGGNPSSVYYENGNLKQSDATAINAFVATSPLKMGGAMYGQADSSYYYNGMVSEAIMSDSVALNEQRIFLEANQGSYYGVSVPVSPAMGYVTKWYDQSGSVQNLVQATLLKQPVIGTEMKNNKNVISFNSNYASELTGNYSGNVQSVNAVYSVTGNFTGGAYPSLGGWGATQRLFTHYANITTPYSNSSDLPNGVIYINGKSAASTNTTFDLMARTQTAASPTTLSGSTLSIGVNALSSTRTDLYASELTVFPTAISSTDRVTLEGSQASYYNISSATAVNPFVTKWYDQSTSGNNLIQATAANQPTLILGGLNSKAAIQFGANLFLQTAGNVTFNSGATVNVVAQGTTNNIYWGMIFGQTSQALTNSGGVIGSINDSIGGWGYGFGATNTTNSYWGSSTATVFPATPFIGSGIFNPGGATSSYYYSSGVLLKSNVTALTAVTSTNPLKMGGSWYTGAGDGSYYYNGMVSEAVMYPRNLIYNDRKFIEYSQRDYFSISVGNQ